MNVLWLNSAGFDAELAIDKFLRDNPSSTVTSFTIQHLDKVQMKAAADLAFFKGFSHVILPFNTLRAYIKHPTSENPDTATAMWTFMMHFLGVTYAGANGFDCIVSGHKDDSVTEGLSLYEVLNDAQDVCLRSKKIPVYRPVSTLSAEESINLREAIIRVTR